MSRDRHIPREYFAPNDVAKLTGLSRRTIVSHLETGRLPSAKVGGRILIRADAARAFAEGKDPRETGPKK